MPCPRRIGHVHAPHASLVFSLERLITEEPGGPGELSVDKSAQYKSFEACGVETCGHRFNGRGAMFVLRFAEGLRVLLERLQSEMPEGGGVFRAEETDHLRLAYTLRSNQCECEKC